MPLSGRFPALVAVPHDQKGDQGSAEHPHAPHQQRPAALGARLEIKALGWPSDLRTARRHRPSRDQRELEVFGPPIEVIWVGSEPSAFATQISSVPERVDVNVILVPSAEKSGLWSSNVEAIRSVGPRPGAETGSGKRQMFVSRCSRA